MPTDETPSPTDETPSLTGEPIETVEKGRATVVRIPKKQFLYKKFETALIRYVIRFGERVLFVKDDAPDIDNPPDDDHTTSFIKVAEYIRSELALDDIEIELPVYKQILDEAVARYDDETFVASHYFLTHPDLEISKIAANMMSNKHQLSKIFHDPLEVFLMQPTLTAEHQQPGQREKEREMLERWIVQALYELKNAHIRHAIDEINKQVKALQSDDDAKLALLKKRMELDKMKRLLSNELGGRVVTGI
jgi:DNA primase